MSRRSPARHRPQGPLSLLMNNTPIWQKSKAERATAFATAFAQAEPTERKVPSLTEQLRAVGPLIIKKRQEGFSVEQICAGLKHPDIAIDASPASIRRILVEADRKREQRRKARIAALMPRTTAAPVAPTRANSTASSSATR